MQDVDYDSWTAYINDLIFLHMPTLSTKRKSEILITDCACGTGTVTCRLAKLGFSLTGIDISSDMLSVAADNSRSLGLSIPFVCMDMQSFSLHKPQHVIVSACDGVNYLTSVSEMKSFFSRAYSALADCGLLLFDISSAFKLENILGCNTFADFSDNSVAYIWQNYFDDKSKLLEMKLCFFSEVKNGLFERFEERHVQRAHSVSEVREALFHVGFSKVYAYPAFSFEELINSDDSERIQFVCIKS